tara:strand:- start:271 stop:561 length:291 start_codon:yes stop_codon:yes gene_type:complete
MNIKFVEVDKTLNKIFLNGKYLGTVKMDVWTQKWTMDPIFKVFFDSEDKTKDKYISSYEAGKALVSVYQEKENFFRDPFEGIDSDEVKDVFDSWSP